MLIGGRDDVYKSQSQRSAYDYVYNQGTPQNHIPDHISAQLIAAPVNLMGS